jgi:hypothetical protein
MMVDIQVTFVDVHLLKVINANGGLPDLFMEHSESMGSPKYESNWACRRTHTIRKANSHFTGHEVK